MDSQTDHQFTQAVDRIRQEILDREKRISSARDRVGKLTAEIERWTQERDGLVLAIRTLGFDAPTEGEIQSMKPASKRGRLSKYYEPVFNKLSTMGGKGLDPDEMSEVLARHDIEVDSKKARSAMYNLARAHPAVFSVRDGMIYLSPVEESESSIQGESELGKI